jgi:hypothetical protein
MDDDKRVDAFLENFFDAWATPRSYKGEAVDETSDRPEDRLSTARITDLYAMNACIIWNGENIDPLRFDEAIRQRMPFFANTYKWTTHSGSSDEIVIDVKGWMTPTKRPAQSMDSYQPEAGDMPFAERLELNTHRQLVRDVFASATFALEVPGDGTSLDGREASPSAKASTAASSTPMHSPAMSSTLSPVPTVSQDMSKFIDELYDTAGGFVRRVKFPGATGRFEDTVSRENNWGTFVNDAFFSFFKDGPQTYWGNPFSVGGAEGKTLSPMSYVIADKTLLAQDDSSSTVQVRLKAYLSQGDNGTYYLDLLVLTPTKSNSSLPFIVVGQSREAIAAFRMY